MNILGEILRCIRCSEPSSYTPLDQVGPTWMSARWRPHIKCMHEFFFFQFFERSQCEICPLPFGCSIGIDLIYVHIMNLDKNVSFLLTTRTKVSKSLGTSINNMWSKIKSTIPNIQKIASTFRTPDHSLHDLSDLRKTHMVCIEIKPSSAWFLSFSFPATLYDKGPHMGKIWPPFLAHMSLLSLAIYME